jgi:arylsulfatase A-like enzyme
MKYASSLFLVILFFCLIQCNPEEDSKESIKPNILLINIDDMGWRDVGFMGSEYYETPNLDQLAAGGMIFTNAYASASNCAPSRACMMSGQWTPRHGIYTVASSERGKSKDRKLIPTPNNGYMPEDNVLIPGVLKNAGYATCHAGKWHLNDDPTFFGFDINIGGSHAGNPGSYYPPYKNVPALDAPSEEYYLTNLIMDKTLQFLNAVQEKPFFLYYSPYAVHTPIHPVDSLLPRYEGKPAWNGQDNAKYATMVENLDIQIGRLIENLKKSGKLENTFIIFTSDNGGHYGITKQWPLRSGKGSYYEGGIREPMFVYWKNKIQPGTKSDIPITNIDFYPTILEVAGITKPTGKILDGKSILPVLTENGVLEQRPLFWHFPIYLQAYVKNDTTTQDPLFRTRPGSAIRLGDWKLIQYFENNDIELYNLKEDISERNNLAVSNPQKTEELLGILEEWRKGTNAPIPKELNPQYWKKTIKETTQ